MNAVSNRGFGIELEMYGMTAQRVATALTAAGIETRAEDYNHTTRTHWKVVSDSSIRGAGGGRTRYGLELVSPILRGEEGLRQIRVVCGVLTRLGLKINRSTGFHVHHDIADYSLRDWKMMLLQYVKHEDTVSSFLPLSRHHNSFCKKLRTRWNCLETAFAQIQQSETVQALMRLVNGGDRYYTVNVQNWSLRGTVEFRQHSGTLNADKVISWVLLTQAMVEYAKILRYFNTQGADKASNLFAFRRYFPEPQKSAVQALPTYFKGRAEALSQAMEG